MSLNQLTKHFCHSDWAFSKTCILNASTASSGVEKRWALTLFFTYGNKKKSFGGKSQLYGGWLIKSMFWVLKNAVVWADVWERALSSWRVIRLRRLFSLFLGRQLANKWLCTTQNWLFCVVLVVRLQYVQLFRKNRRSFAWKCLVREQLFLDLVHLFTFGLICINPRFITCHDSIGVCRSTTIVFLEHFFRPIDTSLFLSDWQIV